MSDEYEGNKRREMRWEQMRGTPPPKSTDEVWKERHLLQEQHIIQLENRLRALWDKCDGDRKHYLKRIKMLEGHIELLESVGDSLFNGVTRIEAEQRWHKAKEAKP